MAGMMVFQTRLVLAVTTLPKARDWAELCLAALTLGVCAALVGKSLLAPNLVPISGWIPIAATALIVPAITEEVAFRGLLIPGRTERFNAAFWLVISTALFVLWHIVEVATFLPGAASIFLRPDFLCLAAILGGLCGVLRWRSASLWTAVVLHWAAVVVWKIGLGGPSLDSLRGPLA